MGRKLTGTEPQPPGPGPARGPGARPTGPGPRQPEPGTRSLSLMKMLRRVQNEMFIYNLTYSDSLKRLL